MGTSLTIDGIGAAQADGDAWYMERKSPVVATGQRVVDKGHRALVCMDDRDGTDARFSARY